MMKAVVILALFGCASAGNVLGGIAYGAPAVHAGYAAHAHADAAHAAEGIAYINGAAHSLAVHAQNAAARNAHDLSAQIATQNAINHDGAARNAAAAGAIQNYAAARNAAIQADQVALQRGITLAGPAPVAAYAVPAAGAAYAVPAAISGYGYGVPAAFGGYGGFGLGFGGYGAGVYGKAH